MPTFSFFQAVSVVSTLASSAMTASRVAIMQSANPPFVSVSLLACLLASLMHILLEIMSATVVVCGI